MRLKEFKMFPLCALYIIYPLLYHLKLKNNKATNFQNNDIFETQKLKMKCS